MNPLRMPIAMFAFLAFVAVVPAWMFFVDNFTSSLSTETSFLATLVLPATAALFLAGWVQPGGG